MKLYHSSGSPNARRVRFFVADKELDIELVAVDLGKKEQFTEAHRAINPRLQVPALMLDDGTTIAEVPAIWRYLEARFPQKPLLGRDAKEIGLIAMAERRAELDGFMPTMEAVRNAVPGLAGRALSGPHDYDQIPALVERSRARIDNFYADLEAQLSRTAFVAGETFSVADITAFVTIDFATAAAGKPLPPQHQPTRRWYDQVASRPAARA